MVQSTMGANKLSAMGKHSANGDKESEHEPCKDLLQRVLGADAGQYDVCEAMFEDVDQRQVSELMYLSKFHRRTYRSCDSANHHTKQSQLERLWKAQQEQEQEPKNTFPCGNLTREAVNLFSLSTVLFCGVFLAVGEVKALAAEKGSQSRQHHAVGAIITTLSCVLTLIAICQPRWKTLLQIKGSWSNGNLEEVEPEEMKPHVQARLAFLPSRRYYADTKEIEVEPEEMMPHVEARLAFLPSRRCHADAKEISVEPEERMPHVEARLAFLPGRRYETHATQISEERTSKEHAEVELDFEPEEMKPHTEARLAFLPCRSYRAHATLVSEEQDSAEHVEMEKEVE